MNAALALACRRVLWTAWVALAVLATSAPASALELDPAQIGKAAGVQAQRQDDGVVRIGWSRSDVAVTVDGMPLPPAAGLGSWAAFAPVGDHAMMMADTVVFQDEVDAAMDAAFAHGLQVTGLHNHFFYDRPQVYFMHLGGEGTAPGLADGVKAVWDAIKGVRAGHARPVEGFGGGAPTSGALDAAAIGSIVGHPALVGGGVAKVTIGGSARMHGQAIGASMGLATWAAFSGSDASAAVDGDFILRADEVQPVLHALRKAGIHVVALHNHMIGESPATWFTHFWGKGPAAELAHGFRSALDAQAAAHAQ